MDGIQIVLSTGIFVVALIGLVVDIIDKTTRK
ncbi:hypothetical protein JOD45_001431 [Scopulibacillus daqui]|uniref:Holin-like toxin n=1 Tax=Scopulibacillus daqui TaxID=1469162 RepID=A0ABS2PZS9_9BACL|nr:putative holin-like toxin [Scopulibacillus daqui]MBM7645220.1 hypothetical protein [Scopulibacillus daqui]